MKTSRFIARTLGLFGLIFCFAFLASGGSLLERLITAMCDPGILLMSACMTLTIGIAIVVGHNVWDGTWRVVITVIGYLSLLKGFILLAWPDSIMEFSKGMVESGMMPVQIMFSVAFYGWLTWLGFREEQENSPATDTP